MQHSESADALAQTSEQPVSAALSQKADQALDQLTHLAALAQSVRQAYSSQLKLTGQIATAEWQLTGRSLTMAAALVVCFGAGLILLWGSILVVLGYLLFQLSGSVVITAVALVLLQSGLLVWCWRSLGFLLSQAGFANTLQQLRLLFFATAAERKNADPTAS